MKKLLVLFYTLLCACAFASPIQVSLITCGTGEELYASFGHSGIRIIDSASGTDDIYNYGMFNFSDPNFYVKFTRGTLMYFSAKEPSENFMYVYQMDKREVKEQILDLTTAQIIALRNVLDSNNLEQNKYYKYDFLFNNCSTKLRDIFEKLYGNNLQFQKVLPDDSLTFMGMLNSYLTQKHLERIGIDIILCSRVNDKMTNRESMFLPEWLSDNFAIATLNGKTLVSQTRILIPDGEAKTTVFNLPFLGFSFFGAWMIIGSIWKPNAKVWRWFDAIFFSTLGLLGCFFIFMWFGADHVETNYNACMLWALPLHIAFAWLMVKNKIKTYANISFLLALIALLIIHPFIQSTAVEIYGIIALVVVRLYQYTSWRSL